MGFLLASADCIFQLFLTTMGELATAQFTIILLLVTIRTPGHPPSLPEISSQLRYNSHAPTLQGVKIAIKALIPVVFPCINPPSVVYCLYGLPKGVQHHCLKHQWPGRSSPGKLIQQLQYSCFDCFSSWNIRAPLFSIRMHIIPAYQTMAVKRLRLSNRRKKAVNKKKPPL